MKSKRAFLVWAIFIIISLTIGIILKNNDNRESIDEQITLLGSINSSMINEVKNVFGIVTSIDEKEYENPVITLSDGTAFVNIRSSENDRADVSKFAVGQRYEIVGKVYMNGDEIEIEPLDKGSVVVSKEHVTITKENIGQLTTVLCDVLSVYAHPEGHYFLTVKTNDKEETEIPIFKSLGFDASNIKSGDRLVVRAEVSEYNGKMELIPVESNAIIVMNYAQENQVRDIVIKDITKSDRGKVVELRGIPRDVKEYNGHLFLKLEDEGAQIKAVLFKADATENLGRKEKLYDYEKRSKHVRILGTVDLYEGELEIIIDKVYKED